MLKINPPPKKKLNFDNFNLLTELDKNHNQQIKNGIKSILLKNAHKNDNQQTKSVSK